ncbi:MAG: hypothetical protein Q8Q33_01120 [Chlamydiota bacterium]|nr:hypothetical protein [Chlamydiota bacterium]
MLNIISLTIKEVIRSKATGFLLFFSIIVLSLLHFFAGFSVAEQEKFVIDIGFGATTFFTLILSVYFSSHIVSNDLAKNRIAVILISIRRNMDYIIGRFLGLAILLALAVILMGLVLEFSILFHQWILVKQQAMAVMKELDTYKVMDKHVFINFGSLVMGLWSIYLQSIIIAAISMFISVCSNTNFAIVASILIYVVGQIYVYIVLLAFKSGIIIGYLLKCVFLFVPRIDFFNIYESIALHQPITNSYMAWISFYAILVVILFLILTCLRFNRREI